MRRLAMALRRLPRAQSGIAAVEFALVAPVALILMCGMADIGTAMWRTMRLEVAARNGAQYAFANPQDSAGIEAAVRNTLTGWSNLTVAPTTMTCTCDNGTAADCTTGICSVNGASLAPIIRISVTVTQTFQHVSPISAAFLPGLSPLRGNVEVRCTEAAGRRLEHDCCKTEP